jgi:hypothetical protein
MKQVGSLSKCLACAVLLGTLLATESAEAKPGKATVRAMLGSADFSNRSFSGWREVRQGLVMREGSVVRTHADSRVDLFLGVNGPVVRLTENTEMSLDSLNYELTGAETVINTVLDLRAGRILGRVKKMATASKYEVKTPSGVAGIRGTKYDISVLGVVRIPDGEAIWVTLVNGVMRSFQIMGGQYYNPQTGSVLQIPPQILPQIIQQINDLDTGLFPGTDNVTNLPLALEEDIVLQEQINRSGINDQQVYTGTTSSSQQGVVDDYVPPDDNDTD